MHLVAAGDDVSPGLAGGAEENRPGGRGWRKPGCCHPGGQTHGVTARCHVQEGLREAHELMVFVEQTVTLGRREGHKEPSEVLVCCFLSRAVVP